MKTDTQTANEKTKPADKTLEILKKYFPQCFLKPDTDENGNIIKEHFDTEKLSALLDDNVDITKEGFTLNFLGKSYARYQANLESETVIVPDAENSKTESKNIYIVGDNLDALQHLRHSYSEKIKCIYIDPPYNTGKDDFVYNDKFGFTAKELVEKLDIDEDEAERIVEMQGKCTHSAWLTFMYPRLSLARDLLRDDGVIFISIDDNEQANLKRLCDEVFGEGNFVGDIVWNSTKSVTNTALISLAHTHNLTYFKNKNYFIENRTEFRLNEDGSGFSNPDNDPKGAWKADPFQVGGWRPNQQYEIKNPTTGEVFLPAPGCSWKNDYKKFIELWNEGRIIFGKDGKSEPKRKRYIWEAEERGCVSTTLWTEVDTTTNATKYLKDLFDGKIVFSNPKPVSLIHKFLELGTNVKDDDECIILDFFSGSATTAEAVLKINSEDKKNRKFILVQLPENLDSQVIENSSKNNQCAVEAISILDKLGKKHTIDEIGRERIRRAATKIKSENPDTKADLGFKTYYLKSMPQNTLDKIKIFNPKELFSSDGDIVKSLGEETLLQTWQIKDGFGFDCIQQKIDIEGCTAYLLESEEIGKYLYLLTQMSENSIKELIRRIEAKELALSKVFIYGYSFDFDSLTSLTKNLEMLKNRDKIEAIIRY
jgi:adenine-specific DNA-methyltransferase